MTEEPFPGSSADFYERIMTTQEKLNQANARIAEKDAIISRLSQQRSAENAGYFGHVIIEHRKLITELADALASYRDLHWQELVERAREATK